MGPWARPLHGRGVRSRADSTRLDAAFAAEWNALFSTNYRRAERPASVEQSSPAGHRHAVGQGEVEDLAGNRLLVRLLVFPLAANSQWIVLIGNGAQALAACEDGWNAFFASLRFRSVDTDAGSSAPLSAAAPPGAQAAAPDARVATPGTPQQFENITFLPPLGWTVRRGNGFVQLSPSDARSLEKLDVLLLPGRVSSASLERELEGTWSEIRSLLAAQPLMTVNQRPYDPDEPAETLGGVPYLRGDGGMLRTDGAWVVSAWVLRAGNRVERAAVVARVIRENLNVTNAALELTTNRTPHRYIRLMMPQAPRLDGTWCYDGGSCLRLTADGRFQDAGAVRAVHHETYPWPTTPARGEGQYTLRDRTLILAYDGGPELRLAFPGVEDPTTSSPAVLRIGFRPDLLTRGEPGAARDPDRPAGAALNRLFSVPR